MVVHGLLASVSSDELPAHAQANRRLWDDRHSTWFGSRAAAQWAAEPHWGIWATPEADLHVFPDLEDRDVIDLGCGTGYIGAWVLRAGGRPVGIDNSAEQLATARSLQDEFDLHYPLIHGNAEHVPMPGSSFDVAISEYGASSWCDPYAWIPEAARLLRPGGQLIFLRNSTLLEMCIGTDPGTPAGTTLSKPQTSLPRIDRTDGGTHYQLPTGDMIRLLIASGLRVDDLVEVIVPSDARTDFDYATADWASRWPSVELWKATKTPMHDTA